MIKSFASRETEHLFHGNITLDLPHQLQKVALRKLWMIDAASRVDDLRIPPGNRLEKLKQNRKDQYSIRINDQWRICFKWKEGAAYEVEVVDYH